MITRATFDVVGGVWSIRDDLRGLNSMKCFIMGKMRRSFIPSKEEERLEKE